jgi:hypothetical protein
MVTHGKLILYWPSSEKICSIDGPLNFVDDDDYEEFKVNLQYAFEFMVDYHVPEIFTEDEYEQISGEIREVTSDGTDQV